MSASIAAAPWLNAAETRAVMAALEAARPNGSRFVGGCVRNTLLNTHVDDIDIATQLLPEAVIAAAKQAGLAAHPTGIAHGTITIVANHKPFEVTTLRRDVETDGRHATVAFTESWEEDAQRRDFRINALYAGADGVVHDPTNGGLDDLGARRIVFIGDAETRIREDYLRILRFFRFNAWYGRGALDAVGLRACAALKAGLSGLSAERVWKESKKLLASADPRASVAAMEASGVRAMAWPEAVRGARLEKLVALEMPAASDPLLRFAALLPDVAGARALAQRLKASNDERDRLVSALGDEPRLALDLTPHQVRRAIYRLGQQTFADRVLLAWADDAANPGWRALFDAAAWTPPKLPVSGEDAMAAGAPPGPRVGEVLREIEAWWIDADFPDDRAALLARLKAASSKTP